jgi:aminoglycoside phosphotransferase (APT) family kinase protein
MPDFLRREDVAASYQAATGYEPRDLDFYTLYAALRHAVVMFRVARRQLHFGEREPTEDPDDLIMHRSSVERMLAGSYWS